MSRYKYIIVLISVWLSGCCTNDDATTSPNEEVLACQTQDLGIDELSKFSNIVYHLPGGEINQEWSSRWLWKIQNDTIEIAGNTFIEYDTRHIILKKNSENCVDLLFARYISFDDEVVIDEDTGEIISGGYYWTDFNDLAFTIQEYIEDERLICQVGTLTVWMDFTLDTQNHEWQFNPKL